jgi:hypothetical protein
MKKANILFYPVVSVNTAGVFPGGGVCCPGRHVSARVDIIFSYDKYMI